MLPPMASFPLAALLLLALVSTAQSASSTGTDASESTTTSTSYNVVPLTTTFTPSSYCTIDLVRLTGAGVTCTSSVSSLLVPCYYLHLGPADSTSDCLPSGWGPSETDIYSPGVCPVGYTRACSSVRTETATATAKVTSAICCPSGYTCQSANNWPWFTTDICTTMMEASATIVFTTSVAGQGMSTITSLGIEGFNAYGVRIVFESTDTEATATAAATTSTSGSSSATAGATVTGSTATSTPTNGGSSGGGLSSGGKAGVGVGVGLGVPIVAAAIFGAFWLSRRRQRQQQQREQEPGSSMGPMGPMGSIPQLPTGADNEYKYQYVPAGSPPPGAYEMPANQVWPAAELPGGGGGGGSAYGSAPAGMGMVVGTSADAAEATTTSAMPSRPATQSPVLRSAAQSPADGNGGGQPAAAATTTTTTTTPSPPSPLPLSLATGPSRLSQAP